MPEIVAFEVDVVKHAGINLQRLRPLHLDGREVRTRLEGIRADEGNGVGDDNRVERYAIGKSVILNTNEPKTHTYQLPVDAKWNTNHLSVVAFIYNDNGVEQAIKTYINQ